MKWTTKKAQAPKTDAAKREQLLSKTVLDDLLGQVSGGAVASLLCCHTQSEL